MTATVSQRLSVELSNRYGEQSRFINLVDTIDGQIVAETDVEFIREIHEALHRPADAELSTTDLLFHWVDSVIALSKEMNVDAGEFRVYWEPIVAMYRNMPGYIETPTTGNDGLLGTAKADTGLTASEIADAEIHAAAIANLTKRYEEGGIKRVIDHYREMAETPSQFDFLHNSIMDLDTNAKLVMEYKRFAKGPDSTQISNDPMIVEHFAMAKVQLDSPVVAWHVADTLKLIDWTHSIMGQGYWNKMIERYDAVR